jgi:hypothetical protein
MDLATDNSSMLLKPNMCLQLAGAPRARALRAARSSARPKIATSM